MYKIIDGRNMINTLQKYLKYDYFSKKMIYSVPKSDLSDLDFGTFPFDFSKDITKKLAINNGVGAITITNDGTPLVFLGATISDVINVARTQGIEIPNTPTNELIILLDNGGGHFKAVLQNDTHHVIHNFYPGQPLFLASSNGDNDDNTSSDHLPMPIASAMLAFSSLPSSCELQSQKNGTQIFSGIYARSDSYKMPQTEKLAIKHDASYALRFKVSDNEFYQIKKEILKIDNQCKNKELLYALLPDEKHEENCFTSINRLVKTANIDTSYMRYFLDYQLQKAGSIADLHFYHYKHKNELNSFEKLSDIIYHHRDFIYNTAIKLAILGTTFLVAKFALPSYAMATTVGFASHIFTPTEDEDIVEGSVHIDKNYQILQCSINNYFTQQCIPSKNPFAICVEELGTQHPLSVDENGTFQRTITSYVWRKGGNIHCSNIKPENDSFCIEHHVVKYYEEQPELIGDFHEHTYSELAQVS